MSFWHTHTRVRLHARAHAHTYTHTHTHTLTLILTLTQGHVVLARHIPLRELADQPSEPRRSSAGGGRGRGRGGGRGVCVCVCVCVSGTVGCGGWVRCVPVCLPTSSEHTPMRAHTRTHTYTHTHARARAQAESGALSSLFNLDRIPNGLLNFVCEVPKNTVHRLKV